MIKLNKHLNMYIIALTVSLSFLFTGIAYSCPKDFLRIPVGTKTTDERFLKAARDNNPGQPAQDKINPYLLFVPGRDRGNITIDENTIVVFGGGGDCAGLNKYYAQIVLEARKNGFRVVGVRNGYDGLLADNWEENLVELTPDIAEVMADLPSSVLGQARKVLKEEDFAKIKERLGKARGLGLVGGNDHLKEAEKIFEKCRIVTVGASKSIDDDFGIGMMGFWSAVLLGRQIVVRAVSDFQEIDNTAIVFEVMGRKCGSLTEEIAKACPYPHRVIIPEFPVTVKTIKEAVAQGIRVFFVSEGMSLVHDRDLDDLLDADPTLKAMFMSKPDIDIHNNPKLTGTSLFVKGIIEHFSKLKVQRTDITYQLRGAELQAEKPDEESLDSLIARQFGSKAVELIKKGIGGKALTWSTHYTREGEVLAEDAKKVYQARDLKTTMSDKDLADSEVLGVEGYVISNRAPTVEISKRGISLEAWLRELFLSTAVSGRAHRSSSVVEVNADSGVIVAACGKESRVQKELSPVSSIVNDATKGSFLLLIPEEDLNFREIGERILDIRKREGYINVVISKDFKLDKEDPVLKAILEKDPILKAKFESHGQVIDDGRYVKFESGVSNFIAGLFKELGLGGIRITDFGYAGKGLRRKYSTKRLNNEDFLERQGVLTFAGSRIAGKSI